jgi:hypothetical protein
MPKLFKCEDCGELFPRTQDTIFPLCKCCLELRVTEDGACLDDLIAEFEGGLYG